MQWIFLLPFLFSAFLNANAVPPAPGMGPKYVDGDPVTLRWEKPTQKPTLLIWMQEDSTHKFFQVKKSETSSQIPRKGRKKLPTELLVIPKNASLRPKIITIPENQNNATFHTKPISRNEIWFWGRTPNSPCPHPMGTNLLEINTRILNDSAKQTSFKGGFLWKITRRNESPPRTRTVHFSSEVIGHEGIKTISSQGLLQAETTQSKACREHDEKPCPFLFKLKSQIWGKHLRIRITPRTDLSCPDY